MSTPNTYTINLNIKRKTGKVSAVLAVIRPRGQKTVIVPTGVSVEIADWVPRRQRCKTNTEANAQLDKIEAEIRNKIKYQGIGAIGGIQKEPRAMILAKKESVEKLGSENSGKVYQTLLANMDNFEKEQKVKHQFSTEYGNKFAKWLAARHADGHTSRIITAYRTVAAENDIMIGKINKPKNRAKDSIYLTENEIETLENYLPKLESEIWAKDMFLVLCYTGLRFVDLHRAAQIKSIGEKNVIVLKNQKTDIEVGIPAREKLMEILRRYQKIKPITNQYLNRKIKEVAKNAGMIEEITITEYQGGKAVSRKRPKYELITCHTARRSFATNAVEAGIPVHVVMKFTGHKSLSSFQKYLKNSWSAAVAAYQGHPFFT